MFIYSIIIPHKNCPDLLRRCVDSIPEREDVQIIVVDDNSDEGKKQSLKEFKNLQVVLLDSSQSKSAGRARNVGISTLAAEEKIRQRISQVKEVLVNVRSGLLPLDDDNGTFRDALAVWLQALNE